VSRANGARHPEGYTSPRIQEGAAR
jgi:hypothetical protein